MSAANDPPAFKIKRNVEDADYYCILDNEEVACVEGINNIVSVCLYFLHYVKQERTSNSDLVTLSKSPEGQKLDFLLKSFSIGGRFKNVN